MRTDGPHAVQIPDTWGSQMDGQQTGEFRLDLSDNDLSGPIPAGFDGGLPYALPHVDAGWPTVRSAMVMLQAIIAASRVPVCSMTAVLR